MQLRNLAFVLCRLLALVIAVFMVLPLTGSSMATMLADMLVASHFPRGPRLILTAAVMLLFLAPALFIWFKADWLSRKIAPFETELTSTPDVDALQQAIFGFFGLYLVVYSLHDLWNLIFFVFWTNRFDPNMLDSIRSGPPAASIAFSLGIGMYLLLGSRGVVGLIHSLRQAGARYG